MADWNAAGWLGLTRATTVMFGTGAVLTAASVLAPTPAGVNRLGILAVAVAAGLASAAVLLLGQRYTIGMSHLFAAAGSVMIALAVLLADGTYLSLLYPMFFVWIAQYAAVFLGWRGALAQVAFGAVAHAAVLGVLPPPQRLPSWGVTLGTGLAVIFCYRLFDHLSARLRALVERSGGVTAIVDREQVIRSARGPVQRVLGHAPDALAGVSLAGLVHARDRPHVAQVLSRATDDAGLVGTFQARLRRADGTWIHIEGSVENALDDRAVGGLVVSLRDVTERAELQAQLEHQAFHDALTGLANRALFSDRVQHALRRRREPDDQLTVLFIDLDDFKAVNDSLGHTAGDALLRAIAGRLAVTVRESDTVARLGGDEFAVLVESVPAPELVDELADRLLAALTAPVRLDTAEVVVGASIGVAVSTTGTRSATELLRDADTAMYQAKQDGKGRTRRFDPVRHAQVVRNLQLKTELRHALERDQLRLEYQPTVDLVTGEVHGFEALLRWHHPDLGLVPPAEFIPLAEESDDLIVPIGRWVLERACAQAQRWHDLRPDAPPITLSVNVSGRQLASDRLVDDVQRALGRTVLPPTSLILEITESVLLADVDATARRLQRIRDLGVRVAVDDFGTGYSSLTYLNRLPIDVLKVDRSFVASMRADRERFSLVHSIVQVGRTLGLRTIAEGIEHDDQAQLLRDLRCDYGQGYLFARPMDPASVPAYLAAHGSSHPTVHRMQRQDTAR